MIHFPVKWETTSHTTHPPEPAPLPLDWTESSPSRGGGGNKMPPLGEETRGFKGEEVEKEVPFS